MKLGLTLTQLSTITISSFNATISHVSALCQTQCEIFKYILSNPREFSLTQHLKQLTTLLEITQHITDLNFKPNSEAWKPVFCYTTPVVLNPGIKGGTFFKSPTPRESNYLEESPRDFKASR